MIPKEATIRGLISILQDPSFWSESRTAIVESAIGWIRDQPIQDYPKDNRDCKTCGGKLTLKCEECGDVPT